MLIAPPIGNVFLHALGGRETMETNRIVQTSGNRPSEHYTSLLLIVMNTCHLYIILFIVCVCVCVFGGFSGD